jgi:hypothetical protein
MKMSSSTKSRIINEGYTYDLFGVGNVVRK